MTGGYVYRGQSPGMQGLYFFADFITDQLWSFQVVDGKAIDVVNRTSQLLADGGTVDAISSFAEDGHGNLYIIGLDGEIHRLDPHAAAGDGNDRISGGVGNDSIYGGAGADLLFGGTGNDKVLGGQGRDVLSGGLGNDRLTGGRDADSLAGGEGNDILVGSEGRDRFSFASGGGSDRVMDFEDDQDTIRLNSNLGITTVGEALDHAIENNGNVLFTFDNGEVLRVLGTTKLALADDITILI